jgi:hypothetical protein
MKAEEFCEDPVPIPVLKIKAEAEVSCLTLYAQY